MGKIVRCNSCGCLCRKEETGLWPATMAEMHKHIEQLESENTKLKLAAGKSTGMDQTISDLALLGIKLRMGGNPQATQAVREQIDAIVMKLASSMIR